MLSDEGTYQYWIKIPPHCWRTGWAAAAQEISTTPPEVYSQLRSPAGRVPLLYRLPKVHKPDAPLRPIISFVSSHASSFWQGYIYVYYSPGSWPNHLNMSGTLKHLSISCAGWWWSFSGNTHTQSLQAACRLLEPAGFIAFICSFCLSISSTVHVCGHLQLMYFLCQSLHDEFHQ